MARVIGFEGSANKLGIGIIDGDKILANVRSTYVPRVGEGFKITDAAAHHQSKIFPVLKQALKEADISIHQIDYLAYTAGPGIGLCLQVVGLFVKVLSEKYNIPVIPVNHCVAHIEMGIFVTRAKNPTILYVSGGNTQIIVYRNKKYVIFGETLDIAVGNCIDRLARELKIPNAPSPGYNVEKVALRGTNYIPLPYVVKGTDVSFSGTMSYISRYLKDKEVTEELAADLCFSLQETVFSMLVEVTERAMACTGSKEVLVVGGVGCNKRLQEMARVMAEARGGKGYSADERYCIDNGLMIAHTAHKMISAGVSPENTLRVTQRYRTDSVDVVWRE